MTTNTSLLDHGKVMTKQHRGPDPKWAILLNDELFPMPRQKIVVRDILDQCGVAAGFALERDYGGSRDVVFADSANVDLAEGNVFRTTADCEKTPSHQASSSAKLAFILDDHWEVTLNARQTGRSLKHLFGVPDESELLRDFESPMDEAIQNGDSVLFGDGPVFTLRHVTLTVTVNNKHVRFTRHSVTALDLKKTAIAQQVNIQIGFVLFRIKPDGSISAAISDDQVVKLKEGDAFRCVASDDTSWH